MKIVVSGASGLIGEALTLMLSERGDEVCRLVRRTPISDAEIKWDPYAKQIESDKLIDTDVVINLSGENIAKGRWSEDMKRRLIDSRVKTTAFLSEIIDGMENPPHTWINASAVGCYGHGFSLAKSEDDGYGEGFLAEVAKLWEGAAILSKSRNTRVVLARIGVVLCREGGALGKMLLPFQLGLGGVLGDGRQMMSWISLDDIIKAFCHLIDNESVKGPVNLVAPDAVSNREFTKTLGKVLRRPTIFPVPAFVLRTLLGEMAQELLLNSIHAEPKRLQETGFSFMHENLEAALKDILSKR